MNKRIKFPVLATVVVLVILMVMQYLWIDRTFRSEQNRVKTEASLLLAGCIVTKYEIAYQPP